MDKYPFYFEATYSDNISGETYCEGGFIIATDYSEAMQQIIAIYEPGLVDIKLECLEDCALIFNVDKAREIKGLVDANA